MRKLVVVVLLWGALLFGMPGAGAATSGLAYTEESVFTVGESSVQVVTTAVMSNTTSERRSGNTIYYSYFDQFQHVVPRGSTNVSVVSRGAPLSFELERIDDDFSLLIVPLPTQLRSGQSRTFELSYDLPTGTIRSEGIFFSNPAFHSFPVWSFSDPDTGSLTLRVPANADLTQFDGALRMVGVDDGWQIWEPRDFSVPEDFFSFVTITVDDALIDETFQVAGQDIVVRTWPGDEVWATFARDTIENGVPVLEDLIGLPIPDQETLEITESVTPYFYGYAGWYDPADTSIEVGNDLDDTVMIHELSHAWFNNGLFTERWFIEGLAEEFTFQAQRSLGWPTETPPTRPLPAEPGALPLVNWRNTVGTTSAGDDLRDTEEYGYTTSWYTVHELVEHIGMDGMRAVIAAADADIISYVGDDPREQTDRRDDWRRVLDLASNTVGPEDELAIEQLFADYVVAPDVSDELSDRREARAAYAEFSSLDPGWRVPTEVRKALTEWDFERAIAEMGVARGVLDRHLEVDAAVAGRGLESSDAVRRAYEADEPAFDDALRLLDARASSLSEIDRLRDTFQRPLTTNQRWGMGEVDLEPLVAHAENAFSLDDFGEIRAAQADMEDTLAAAELVGAERILWTKIGGGAALLFLVAGVVVITRSRRSTTGTKDRDLTQDDVVLSV